MKPQTKGGVKLTNKRKSALNRLQIQLSIGTKPSKDITTIGGVIPLSLVDIDRIKKEIVTLTSKIKG